MTNAAGAARTRPASSTGERSAPSTGLAILAACAPLVFVTMACPLLTFALPGGSAGIGHAIQEAGFTIWLVFGAALLAALAMPILVALSVKGRPIPVAISLAFAASPWLVGLAGAAFGISRAVAAIQNADAASRALMMAMGIAEATNNRLFGAALSSALFASLALGLAIASIAQRAPGRSFLGAVVGLAAAIPLFGITAFVMMSFVSAGAIELVMASVVAIATCAMAAFGAGEDARSGALAASAPIAAGLALCAGIVCMSSVATIEMFGAVAVMDPASRLSAFAQAATEMQPIAIARTAAGPLTLLAAAVVSAWAATRARPSIGGLIGGAAVVATAALVLAADLLGDGHASEAMARMARDGWTHADGLSTVRLPHDDRFSGTPDAVVRLEGLAAPDGSMIAPFSDPAFATRLRDLAHADFPSNGGEADDAFTAEPDVELGIDSHIDAARLRRLIDASRESGLRAILFVGLGPAASEEAREAVVDAFPLVAPALDTYGSVRVVLGSAVRADVIDTDPILYHATVGATPLTQVDVRAGAQASADDRSIAEENRGPYDPSALRPLYLAMSDDATASSVLVTAARAAARGFTPVLVGREIPGHPERAAAELPADPWGGHSDDTIGLGNLGGLGVPGGTFGSLTGDPERPSSGRPTVRFGSMDVVGPLSPEMIRRVVRRHSSEIEACYTNEGAGHEGTLRVRYAISPAGTVMSAQVVDSTLQAPAAERCIVSAVQRWRFPSPEGGIVTVTQPFVFSASG